MFRKTSLLAATLLLFSAAGAAQGVPPQQASDTMLDILQKELQSNYTQLQRQAVKPYFMSYRVNDVRQTTISSSFGVISTDEQQRQVTLTPQVRVGSMELDNYKYSIQADPSGHDVVTFPFDGSTDAIATNIWSVTLDRYRLAKSVYEQTRSRAATTVADEDKAPCFSPAPVERYYEAPLPEAAVAIDRKAWEQRLNQVSAVFCDDAQLTTGSADLEFTATRTWLVNTDGTSVTQNRVTARVMLSVGTMADDGMQLPLYSDFFSFSADSLPSVDSMMVVARDLKRRVLALRAAPVANPYTGPAILSGPASGVFFHEIFGHRLEAHRLKQGGETFRKMVGKEVLPKEFSVISDPTMRTYHGQDMNGYYLYDSEGVHARRVFNVKDGVLRDFLVSRVPLDSFPTSNGHGRASTGFDPVSRQSNLIVETTKPLTEAQLRQRLIAECRKQGKQYGYLFQTVTSGYTYTGQDNSINSFNVTPVEVYRVYVDGRPDELVRGVSLIGTPLSMFSHIEYGGDTPATFTGFCGAESGWVPVTASSPAIFVSQIETQRVPKSENVPPVLSQPVMRSPLAAGASEDEVISRAMQDEMKRSMDSLQIEGAPKPFLIKYFVNRSRTFQIVSELGGVSQLDIQPWKGAAGAHVLLGDYKRTSDVRGTYLVYSFEDDQQVDYTQLRRSLWMLTDVDYKGAINRMAQKESLLAERPMPRALDTIPDLLPVEAVSHHEDAEAATVDEGALVALANRLSAVFNDYPHLYNTSVTIAGKDIVSHRLTSEGVDLKLPHGAVGIMASATFRDDDNVELTDQFILPCVSLDALPSADSLYAQVRRFADNCEALRKAPAVDEHYKGPVMFQGSLVSDVLLDDYLKDGGLWNSAATQITPHVTGEKLGKKVIDPRVTIRNFTSLTQWHGVQLFGHYSIDAMGVKPADGLTLIDKGILRNLLGGVNPTPYAHASTGANRLPSDPVRDYPTLGVGTLEMTATGTTDEANMVKTLIKAAKKQKLAYAYIVFTPQGSMLPRFYRVDVKTGAKTLMKGDDVPTPDDEQAESLLAISSGQQALNNLGSYTYSVICPNSVICDGLEVNKAAYTTAPVDPITYPLLRDKTE